MGLVTFLSVVVFVAAILAGVGVFAWDYYLTGQIKTEYSEIRANEKQLNVPDEITRLDSRIESAKTILAQHIAPTLVFAALQDITLKNVRFMNISYVSDKGKINLSLAGKAADFASVALQSDRFYDSSQNKYFNDVVVSNLNLDESGNVSFSVSATVDPSSVSFAKLAAAMQASQIVPDVSLISTSTQASFGGATTTSVPAASSTVKAKKN